MTWLMLSYFLSIGTMSYDATMMNGWDKVSLSTPEWSFQTTMGFELQGIDNHLFAGMSIETWESGIPDKAFFFNPNQSLYVFKMGLRGWGMELGWRHECDHVTLSDFAMVPSSGFGSNKDEIYFSYTGHLKLF